VKIKVCGVTREEDAKLACELGAWAVGFVFAAHSPRKVSLEQAKILRAAVKKPARCVGVFEGNSAEEIARAAKALRLDAVQLPAAELSRAGGWPAIAVFAPGEEPPPATLAWLVEPKRSPEDRKAGKKPSLDQMRDDWKAASGLRGKGTPVFVAGGLTPETVGRAIEVSKCAGVDVSSGIESAPGVKDAEKLRAFFKAAS
jgi:phosphoribosylanthranilate isomerase